MRLFIVTTGWLLLLQKGEGSTMGPWKGLLNKVTTCSDENQDLPPPLLLKVEKNGKFGRTVTKGSFDSLVLGISNEAEIIVRVHEFKNGRWDLVGTRNMGGTCNTLHAFIPEMWRLLVDHTTAETYTEGGATCVKPASKGEMTVPFDLPPITVDSVPSFIYGIYKIELVLLHPNQTLYGCSAFYADVVAKQTAG
uniref:Acid beta-fructofuranosidase n=1 Tax=Lygus hesperus TaxID=30085 RepID=A0A0A9XJ53_LYGHE